MIVFFPLHISGYKKAQHENQVLPTLPFFILNKERRFWYMGVYCISFLFDYAPHLSGVTPTTVCPQIFPNR